MSAPGAIRWLFAAWRDPGRRRAVATGYAILHKRPLVLADIALRGGLYAPSGAQDAIALARAEGRRELALEIIKLASADPVDLLKLIDRFETPTKDDRR